MGLTNEHVGPKILAKIKIYVLTRAELLFTVCYEIPCTTDVTLLFLPQLNILISIITNNHIFSKLIMITYWKLLLDPYDWLHKGFVPQIQADFLETSRTTSKVYIPSTPNNSYETHTFICLGRTGRFGQR